MWILGFSDRPSNQHVKGIDEARPLPLLFQEGHLGLKVLRRNAPHFFLAHVRCDVVVVLRIEFKFSLHPRGRGGSNTASNESRPTWQCSRNSLKPPKSIPFPPWSTSSLQTKGESLCFQPFFLQVASSHCCQGSTKACLLEPINEDFVKITHKKKIEICCTIE